MHVDGFERSLGMYACMYISVFVFMCVEMLMCMWMALNVAWVCMHVCI